MTREEQITMLEEAFEQGVVALHRRAMDGEYSYESTARVAQTLTAVADSLMYLRSIPNPRGVVPHPRRRSLRLEDA